MSSASSFTVHSPFLAMKSLSRRNLFVTLPVGTVGEIVEAYEDLDRPGFVLIKVAGDTFFTFARDLRDCSYPAESLVS
jgi:hypothetical protein